MHEQEVYWAPAAMCAFRAGALNIARAGVTLGTFVPVQQVLLYQYSKQALAMCALRTGAFNIARARVTVGTRFSCFTGRLPVRACPLYWYKGTNTYWVTLGARRAPPADYLGRLSAHAC